MKQRSGGALAQAPPACQNRKRQMNRTQLFYWYLCNIKIAACLFPELSLDSCFNWILINAFPLPRGWMGRSTPLLIVWPGINGDIFNCKPNYFYVHTELKLSDGSWPPHIYRNHPFNNLWPNWARASFHLEKWHPTYDVLSGENILSIFTGLDAFFRKLAGS